LNAASLADATASLYQETIKTCFSTQDLKTEEIGLPSCVEHKLTQSYYLNNRGKLTVARILSCFAYNQPDIQYCPMLYPIASILRHYLSEEDTYGLLAIMAASKRAKYLYLSKNEFDIAAMTAYELSQKFARKHLVYLEVSSSHEEMMNLFNNWLWWIFHYLPFTHVVRIIDCYLVEGYKIFYRIGFALLRIFVKYLRLGTSKWHGLIKSRGLVGGFMYFCTEIPVSPDALMAKAFRIRRFGRAELHKTYIQTQVQMKTDGRLNAFNRNGGRSLSNDNLPSPQVVDNITATSTTLTYKAGMSTPQPRTKAVRLPIGDLPIHHLESAFLTKNDLITLWHWLPERMTMGTPELIYASNEHGISLNTFYTKSEPWEPTILVIKTTTREVFGAYCSSSWATRNVKDDQGNRQQYFGTGESFLFSFSQGTPSKYPWVNAENNGEAAEGNAHLTKAEAHKKELFMCGKHDMIAIGGGDGNGILLHEGLTQGKTEKCATFNNPPLCQTGDFSVAAIEVYGLFKLDF